QIDWAAASSIFLTSKFQPWARTLQAIRASLLASAIASTLRCSGFDPRLEPVALPALRPDQNNPGRLHEQNAQVAIATLRYPAQDGAVSGRCLLGNKAEPGAKVAPLREHFTAADRSHHRAGDDRADAGHCH